MSELIITPTTILEIKPHPNADRLEICRAGGWDIISGKGNYRVGDTVVHVPPDAMVPKAWADTWGVTPYLSFKKGSEMGRVRAARLRGIASFGFLAPNESGAEMGADLAAHYGIEKYEPPPPPVGMSAGQMSHEHPLFHRYTDIQNLRSFPDMLAYGEPLVVTEKIHGTNSRVGWVKRGETLEAILPGMTSFMGDQPFDKVVGTHRTQRKLEDCGVYGLPWTLYGEALDKLFDWALQAMGHPGIEEPLGLSSLIVFGEIYGAGVQDLHYGAKQEKGYRVFDIAINGTYMNAMAMEAVCEIVGLPTVPILSRGIFTYEELLELANGKTTMDDTHMREGVVVRPMCIERTWGKGELDPHPKRMIFKVISEEYLLRKEGTEYH